MKKLSILLVAAATLILVFRLQSDQKLNEQADLVIFSYNRPLQLYALLESVQKYMQGIGQTIVVCRASDGQYKSGYDVVCADFPHVFFYEQGADPARDFKPLTLKATFESPSQYVIFAVDDIVVKDTVDLAQCICVLEKTGAYAFYLRLGMNLNYCYPDRRPQPLPNFQYEEADIYSWKFGEAVLDWRYPHTVDMTIYRKRDIESELRLLPYNGPNRMEGNWSARIAGKLAQRGLCFRTSKIVNLPLNRVQNDTKNRAMNIDYRELLVQFQSGKKMNITLLHTIVNKSAHMEYMPTFIARS